MLHQTMTNAWARRLIEAEVQTVPRNAKSELATLRVYERLRRQLCAPVGVGSFQALATRALVSAKSRSPELRDVEIRADGVLIGIGEVGAKLEKDERSALGVILISELLGLFLTLLGEVATARLIENATLSSDVEAASKATTASISTENPTILGPFQDILLEAGQLRDVSERLETLAHAHTGVDELMSVAGNLRGIATILDVFTLVRSKAGASDDSLLIPSTDGYLN